MGRDSEVETLQRLGLRTAMVIIALGVVAAIGMRISRPILLDQDDGPATADVALPDARLDLNSAGTAELTLLPGVGPEMARRIVEDRQANGPFASIEDLLRVPRVGDVTIDRIREYVVADGATPAAD